ncbi:restriction endonuclease subunit S [Fibrobacter sp. UWB7]|uniref:restriction endonuclease subunit S n=1 Tax=Fibrobacter sp. UWB7 TaxID=1896206 RepID=UPI00092344D1|nr:restriction endonuclease subunit S [Fibrobacter sp. UWB7]SHM93609.1 type I restriction enzyme, S subunit [Fibrobacter sp. UWB7]
MTWEKVKLGDVSESCLGKMLDQQKNRGDFHPYLANVNVRWGSFDLNDLPLMKFEENEQERYGLKYGDLVICEGGEPGRCAIWKEQVPNMKIQKALHRVRINSDMDYRYVFYWFLYAGKRGALDQYFTGATIKHMPGEKLKQVVIDKPPLKTQKRIADVLSAYDDLIENNQKQIKLLEEAAQRLYKQWFIDFKFPGHETTKIVDGLPEGWKKEKLVDLASVQFGYAFDGSLFNSNGNGTPIVRIRNIPDGVTNDYTTENAPDEYLINNGDIVVGMDGEFHINSWSGETSYLVQRSCCFKPHNPKMKGWLLWAIHDPIKFFEKTVVGATVAHLGKKHIDTIELLVGPEKLYEPFQNLFSKRQTLLNQNRKLVESRDRLLPKLMDNGIEV